MGFTATKKIGNAVKRNRAKRRMRSLFYNNSKQLKSGTYIFVAKASIITMPFEKLQKDFTGVLTRAKSFT